MHHGTDACQQNDRPDKTLLIICLSHKTAKVKRHYHSHLAGRMQEAEQQRKNAHPDRGGEGFRATLQKQSTRECKKQMRCGPERNNHRKSTKEKPKCCTNGNGYCDCGRNHHGDENRHVARQGEQGQAGKLYFKVSVHDASESRWVAKRTSKMIAASKSTSPATTNMAPHFHIYVFPCQNDFFIFYSPFFHRGTLLFRVGQGVAAIKQLLRLRTRHAINFQLVTALKGTHSLAGNVAIGAIRLIFLEVTQLNERLLHPGYRIALVTGA